MKGARDGLAGDGIRSGASVHLCVRVEAAFVRKYWALFDDAGRGRARLDGAGEHAAVPAVQEVGVQAVTSRVTICEDELSAIVLGVEWRHVEIHFVVERDKVVRMRRRTETVIDFTGESHVRLVVRRVEIHTVPATREEYLGPKTIWAIGVADSWCLIPNGAIGAKADGSQRSVVVVVRERDSPEPVDGLRFCGAWVAPGKGISYKDAKAIWEGFNGLIGTAALDIVPAPL